MTAPKRRTVESREYKVMLRSQRFSGDEKALLRAAGAFWRDFCANADDVVIKSEGDLEKIKTRRLITFFDTAKQHLNRSSYILRERRDIDGEDRRITLKFRHADRVVAEDRSMDAVRPQKARTKFEEDIKAPFRSLYSFSATLQNPADKPPRTLGDVARLFPDVTGRFEGARRSEPLAAVNNFTAHEVVVEGGSIRLGKQPNVSAECALIVWSDNAGPGSSPVAVEFSYRYGDKDEKYDGMSALRACDALHVLVKLTKWTDPKGGTKTAFVYQ